MNILHIVTWYSGYHESEIRSGIFHYEQVKSLQNTCNVAIWFPFDETIDNSFSCEIEWDVLTFRSKTQHNAVRQVLSAIKIFKKIRKQFKPDLIHAHVASQAGLIAYSISRFFSIPFIVTEHSPVEMMYLDSKKSLIKNKLVFRASKTNICVSNDLTKKLSCLFPHLQFKTIYNGVIDPKKILLNNRIKQIREENCFNAAIVANFYDKEIKGFQFLLPAIQRINSLSERKIILHICGDGQFLDFYVEKAKELGIMNFCRFYGHCSKLKVYEIVSQMDFGISASLFESAGVSIEEMLLLGKPVVVTKSGGANSLVSENEAIVVDKGSTDALFTGIKEMISKLESYNSSIIREDALSRFEINNISRQYASIYAKYSTIR